MPEKAKINAEHSLKDKQCPIESRRFRSRSPRIAIFPNCALLAALRQVIHRGAGAELRTSRRCRSHGRTCWPAAPPFKAGTLAVTSRIALQHSPPPQWGCLRRTDPLQDPRQIYPLQRLQTRRNRRVIRNVGLVQRWVMGKQAIGKIPCGVVYRPVWLGEID